MAKCRIFILVLFMAGCGGATSTAVLEAVEASTEQIQPIIDRNREICQVIYDCDCTGSCNVELLKDSCRELEKNWRVFQSIQETIVRLAGGEPCGNSCNQ